MFEIVSVGNILTKERKVYSSNLFIHSLKHSLDRLPWDQFLYRIYVHNKPNMIKTKFFDCERCVSFIKSVFHFELNIDIVLRHTSPE